MARVAIANIELTLKRLREPIDGAGWPNAAARTGFSVRMIPPRKYPKRLWQPEEEKQLREMVDAGKTIAMISLRLKRTVTAVRGRLGILKISLGKVGRRPKERPAGVLPAGGAWG